MIGFGIGTGLFLLIMLAVLELNKNTVLGFILLLAVTAAFIFGYAHIVVDSSVREV